MTKLYKLTEKGESKLGDYTAINMMDLLELGQVEEVKEEWPKVGDIYFFVDSFGDLYDRVWNNVKYPDRERRDFLGIYRTREAAEKVRDAIREFVKTLNV